MKKKAPVPFSAITLFLCFICFFSINTIVHADVQSDLQRTLIAYNSFNGNAGDKSELGRDNALGDDIELTMPRSRCRMSKSICFLTNTRSIQMGISTSR